MASFEGYIWRAAVEEHDDIGEWRTGVLSDPHAPFVTFFYAYSVWLFVER